MSKTINPTRDITKAHPLLQKAWAHLEKEYKKRYPDQEQPFLAEVARPAIKQQAYYAQGRKGLHEVNELRKQAGLTPITPKENLKTITNAPAGRSKHERIPSEAFDIAFRKVVNGKVTTDYTPHLYDRCWEIIKEVPEIKWGGDFKFVDKPHFEI